MNHRGSITAAVAAAALLALAAVPCRAELSPLYLEWAAGPAQILMTKAEREEWGRIDNDRDAENFVRLFWARRDPTPDSADNEFRQDFERRAAYADQRFAETTEKGEEVRGSLSDRGRVFILLGPPRRLQAPGAGGVSQGGDFGFGEGAPGSAEPRAAREGPGRGGNYEGAGVASEEVWIYEGDKKPDVIKKKRYQVRFRTEPGSEEVKLYQPEETLSYMAAAAEAAVVRPELTLADLAPAGPTVAETAGGFGAWGAEVVAEPATLEALTASLAAPAKPAALDAHLDASAFQASDGTWLLPVQVAVAGAPPAGTTLVGELVDPASGVAQVAFRGEREWEESKGQRMIKATVLAPPGSYELRTGLASAAGEVLWSGSAAVEVPATTDDFWVSNLILSDNIFPMSHAQEMYEPFAWQGIVVVPKAGRTFPQGDVLWFYVHACQPQLGDDGKPNLRLSMVLSGPAEFRGPVGVTPVKAGDHCWVLAQGLDLVADRFPPGDYRMKVNVRDSTAGKTLVSGADFKVVPAAGG